MEILLRNKEMLAIGGRRDGMRISCGDGGVWVTQQGDSRDHLLGPGQDFESCLAGDIVVTALASSRVSLRRLTAQPWRS